MSDRLTTTHLVVRCDGVLVAANLVDPLAVLFFRGHHDGLAVVLIVDAPYEAVPEDVLARVDGVRKAACF